LKKIDLNVDIGEGQPYDKKLLKLATSANVCCGEHAGSWETSLETIDLCRQAGVRIGMHPGFPDREGYGRRLPEELEGIHEQAWQDSLRDQAERFMAAYPAAYLKPHGAWYGVLFDLTNYSEWNAVWMSICHEYQIPLMAPAYRSLAQDGLVKRYQERGFRFIGEGFPERRYDENYRLIPRYAPGALLIDHAEIGKQALSLAQRCDTLCVHGDSPGCLETLAHIRATLEGSDFEIGF